MEGRARVRRRADPRHHAAEAIRSLKSNATWFIIYALRWTLFTILRHAWRGLAASVFFFLVVWDPVRTWYADEQCAGVCGKQ